MYAGLPSESLYASLSNICTRISPACPSCLLLYANVNIDDFVRPAKGPPMEWQQVRGHVFQAIYRVPRPNFRSDSYHQDPNSTKNLCHGNAAWRTQNRVLGWMVDKMWHQINLLSFRLANFISSLADPPPRPAERLPPTMGLAQGHFVENCPRPTWRKGYLRPTIVVPKPSICTPLPHPCIILLACRLSIPSCRPWRVTYPTLQGDTTIPHVAWYTRCMPVGIGRRFMGTMSSAVHLAHVTAPWHYAEPGHRH